MWHAEQTQKNAALLSLALFSDGSFAFPLTVPLWAWFLCSVPRPNRAGWSPVTDLEKQREERQEKQRNMTKRQRMKAEQEERKKIKDKFKVLYLHDTDLESLEPAQVLREAAEHYVEQGDVAM